MHSEAKSTIITLFPALRNVREYNWWHLVSESMNFSLFGVKIRYAGALINSFFYSNMHKTL